MNTDQVLCNAAFMVGQRIYVLLVTTEPLVVTVGVLRAIVADLLFIIIFGGENFTRAQSDAIHFVIAFSGLEKFVFQANFLSR